METQHPDAATASHLQGQSSREGWLKKHAIAIPRQYVIAIVFGVLVIFAVLFFSRPIEAIPWSFFILVLALLSLTLGILPIAAQALPIWFSLPGEMKANEPQRRNTSLAYTWSSRSPTFLRENIKDWTAFALKLSDKRDPLCNWLYEQFDKDAKKRLKEPHATQDYIARLQPLLLKNLNRLIKGHPIYQEARFKEVNLRDETKELIQKQPQGELLAQLNRLLLEDAFPLELERELPVANELAETRMADQLEQIAEAFKHLHTWHAHVLGIIAVIITGLGLWVAWQESQLHDKQARIEKMQQQIADDQATYNYFTSFEELYTLPVRRRFYRLCEFLRADETNFMSDVGKSNLINDLINETNIVYLGEVSEDRNYTKRHPELLQLIAPDLILDYGTYCDSKTNNPEKLAAEMQTEMVNYLGSLVKTLNEMDMMAKLHEKNETNDFITENWSSALFRGNQLTNFIAQYSASRKYPAWPALSKALVAEELHQNPQASLPARSDR